MPKRKLRSFLKQLIAFKTISEDKESHHGAIEWIEQQLSAAGFVSRRYEYNGWPALVSTTKNTKRPKVLLQSHLDVVPANPGQFDMKEEDGKYVGRGVFDMKFALASFLTLATELDKVSDYDLGIMITCDEEIGGYNGVKKLMDEGYRSDICVLPDGGNNWNIDTASRGVWNHKLIATGDGAHGSRPWEGDNALTRLMEAALEIESKFTNNPDDDVSVAVTTMNSGGAFNQIPDYAEASVDIRFRNEEVLKSTRQTIDRICNKYGVKQEVIVRDSPFKVESGNGYLDKFASLIEKHSSHKPEFSESYGSSDARFMSDVGIPVIITRPIGGDSHGESEWIDAKSLDQFYAILKDFVEYAAKNN
jgi:succinyl-diaminopimelate desuccinylase